MIKKLWVLVSLSVVTAFASAEQKATESFRVSVTLEHEQKTCKDITNLFDPKKPSILKRNDVVLPGDKSCLFTVPPSKSFTICALTEVTSATHCLVEKIDESWTISAGVKSDGNGICAMTCF